MKPIVAIIGRPNVGKSTLFNRIAERKKAIVIDEPGATRDRNYAEASWDGRSFIVVDTGGFEPVSTDRMLVQMREQTNLAIEEADIILFIMDGREGLVPSDQEIAGILRRTGKRVYYVVNKIDGPRHEALTGEFYRLGVDRIFSISAEHGLGIGELMSEAAEGIAAVEEKGEEAEEERIRIAVIGRPNTGKSSLVNRILGIERAIVNPAPGTTRDPVDTPFEFNGKPYLLIDTAGIRRKSRISLKLEKYSIMEALRTLSRSDVALILIDAEEGITEQDAKIAGLAFERGVICIVLVNKWDLVEKDNSTLGIFVKKIKDDLKFLDFAPILFISALTGQRVMNIFKTVEDAYAQYTKRIPTAEINRRVAEFTESNPPPRHRNRVNSIQYATQTSVKPPTFVLFARAPSALHFSYRRYLTNRIRESFGFDLVPIRLLFRKRH
ncbi:MAG: ribosome biogenesis GTPase Der [Syntrophales bacterium]|nr:ribosome biogenesis GTPase Der [Syntrophales bacterium]MDD5531906.1 ribosome biogenesis GTPase Der [Syntrophales bacterium]